MKTSNTMLFFGVRILVVFIMISVLLTTSSCGSFGMSSKEYQTLADQLQSNIDNILPSVIPVDGALTVPENVKFTEVGSKQDLFFVLQDSLYRFVPDTYIQIENYDLFSEYWGDLSSEGALHSAFEYGEVRIEYTDSSPCTMKLVFTYNSAGTILHQFINQEPMVFTDVAIQNLYDKVFEILNDTIRDDMTDLQKVTAIHDYLVINTKYSVTGDLDSLATADSVLIMGVGQCQGYAEAMSLLLILSGVDVRVISGIAYNSDGEGVAHAWNQVLIDDVWYHIDTTWDDPIPDTGDYIYRTYMNRSDEFMKLDHSWSDLFIVCPIDAPVSTDEVAA